MQATLRWALMLAASVAGLVCATSVGVAQSLSPAQEQLYERRRLSLSVAEVATGPRLSTAVPLNITYKWTAYEGFTAITESEFFKRLGMTVEARKAAVHHRRFVGYNVVGACLLISGSALAASTLNASLDSENKHTLAEVGALMVVVGIIPLVKASAYAGNWAPFEAVDGMIDPYNTRLRDRILRGEVSGSRPSRRPEPQRLLIGMRLSAF